jgi:hypothetical protein
VRSIFAPRVVFEQYSLFFPCYGELDLRRPVRRYCVVSHAFRECADFAICGAERAYADAEIRTDGSGSVPTDFRAPSPIPTFRTPEVAGGLVWGIWA